MRMREAHFCNDVEMNQHAAIISITRSQNSTDSCLVQETQEGRDEEIVRFLSRSNSLVSPES